MQLHLDSGNVIGDKRYEAVMDVLTKHLQGSAKVKAMRTMIIERLGEVRFTFVSVHSLSYMLCDAS